MCVSSRCRSEMSPSVSLCQVDMHDLPHAPCPLSTRHTSQMCSGYLELSGPGRAYSIPLCVWVYRAKQPARDAPHLKVAHGSQYAWDPSMHTHTMGIRTSATCDFGHSIGAFSFVTQLRYADKRRNVV